MTSVFDNSDRLAGFDARRICEVSGTASGGNGEILSVDANADDFPSIEFFQVDGTSDSDATAALRPRGRLQQVGVRLELYDDRVLETQLDPDLIRSWSMQNTLGQITPTANIVVRVDKDGVSPLGSPMALRAPVPGMKDVRLGLTYKYAKGPTVTASGEISMPLITGGMVDSGPRVDVGPIFDQLTLHGSIARMKTVPVLFQRTAGSGLSYRAMLYYLVARVTATSNARYGARLLPILRLGTIPPYGRDEPMRKEVNIDGEWISTMREIADVYGLIPYETPEGWLSFALDAPEFGPGRIRGIIDEEDVLRAVNGQVQQLSITPTPAPYTSICLEGSRQTVTENAGRRTLPPLVASTHETSAPATMPYHQDGAGTVTATGGPGSPFDRLVIETTTIIEKDGQTTISTETELRQWHNPSNARYTLDTSLAINGYRACFLEGNGSGDNGHLWLTTRFDLVSKTTLTRHFDIFDRLVSQVTEVWGWLHKRAYLQLRASRSTPWEPTSGAPGPLNRMTLGNGEGVDELRSAFRLVERTTETFDNTDNNFQTYKKSEVKKWGMVPGWQYKYGDGKEYGQAVQSFQAAETHEEWYEFVTEGEWLFRTRTVDKLDPSVLAKGTQAFHFGTPPVSEMLLDLTPNRANYDSDWEWRQALPAAQTDQEPMVVVVTAREIEEVRPRHEMKGLQLPYANSVNQLRRYGRRMLAKGLTRTVTFTMPPDPRVGVGTWWRLRVRRPGIDIDHDALVMNVGLNQGEPGGPIVQSMVMAVHD